MIYRKIFANEMVCKVFDSTLVYSLIFHGGPLEPRDSSEGPRDQNFAGTPGTKLGEQPEIFARGFEANHWGSPRAALEGLPETALGTLGKLLGVPETNIQVVFGFPKSTFGAPIRHRWRLTAGTLCSA